jgi:uncharacterized RDD family membrane protein YckC
VVIRDDDLQINSGNSSAANVSNAASSPRLAQPLDRFAAGVIDYIIVLLPFVYLILAPFERQIKESALYNDQMAISFTTTLAIVTAIAFVILYQALMTWRYSATLGQIILGLRVQSLWPNERVRFGQALLRSVIWSISWLLFGLPLLAIFSNRLRRPLHDRVADTWVVSVRKERVGRTPSRQESALVRGVFWAFGVSLAFVVGVYLVSTLHGLDRQRELVSTLESEEALCESISEAQQDWPEENGKPAERLSVALSLYAAGSIDRKCLQAEVENLHQFDEASPMLYLVKSFIYAEKPEISDRYLKKICDRFANSAECHMSTVIQSVADDDWDTVQSQFALLKDSELVYPAIWAIRQYIKHEDYRSAEEFLRLIPDTRLLADFVVPARTKILWSVNRREEAIGAETTAYANLDLEGKLDLSSFMCFEKLWSDCGAVTDKSCQTFGQITHSYDDIYSSLQTSLAYLRTWECENSGHRDYEALLSYPLNDDVHALVAALAAPGTDGFAELVQDQSAPDMFRAEVVRRMAERSNSVTDLKELSDEWRAKPNTASWQKVGATIFRRLYTLREYKLSAEVADLMNARIELGTGNRTLFENFVIAAFKSGELDRARKFFARYEQSYPLPYTVASRMTASEDSFIDVVKKLRGAK